MAVPTCIQNKILVEIPSKFQEEIVTSGGLKLFRDSTFRPEWNATISGKVVSVPKKLNIGGGMDSIYPNRPFIEQKIMAGDEIIFSYLVVMNRDEFHNNADRFEQEPIEKYGIPGLHVWYNKRGMKIARQYKNNNKWDLVVVDTKTKEVVDQTTCGELEMENFLGRYMPTENFGFNYKNVLSIDNEDKWMVDYAQVYAIKRLDGGFDMVGGNVLIEPLFHPKNDIIQGQIELVGSIEQSKDYKAIGRVKAISEPLKNKKQIDISEGDCVVLDSRYIEKYEIEGVDYWISPQERLLYKHEIA